MSKEFGNIIDTCLEQTVEKVLSKREVPDVEYIQTDNLGEIVEKLAILHTRMWMLEDAIQEATTDKEIADLGKSRGYRKYLVRLRTSCGNVFPRNFQSQETILAH